MKCNGTFIFKTLTHRDSGTFINDEGVEIKYPAVYILKVDEIKDSKEINERKFKVDEKNTLLVNTLKDFEPYQKINIEFEVALFVNRVGLEIIGASDFSEYGD